jgi:hypothetical protein
MCCAFKSLGTLAAKLDNNGRNGEVAPSFGSWHNYNTPLPGLEISPDRLIPLFYIARHNEDLNWKSPAAPSSAKPEAASRLECWKATQMTA